MTNIDTVCLLQNHYSELLYCDGLGPTCGSSDLSHVTHYLKFSVKINTNHLHRHFIKHKPYLEREISKMVLIVL